VTKRYVVLLDESTKEQEDQFMDFVKEHRLGWWHWLSNSWLVADRNGRVSAAKIRDRLMKTHEGINHIVLELTPDEDTWAGFGPASKERDMFNWIRRNWKIEEGK
jgi:hypothetical protein